MRSYNVRIKSVGEIEETRRNGHGVTTEMIGAMKREVIDNPGTIYTATPSSSLVWQKSNWYFIRTTDSFRTPGTRYSWREDWLEFL